MKCEIKEKFLYFKDCSKQELNILNRLLTWEDKKGEKDCLLFEPDKEPFTFAGLYKPLKEKFQEDLELLNPPKIELEKHDVPADLLKGITLFDFQAKGVLKSAMLKNGLLEVPTGGGKSEMILATLRYLFKEDLINKALIIVPSVNLATQLYDRGILRGFSPDEMGLVNQSSKDYDKPIVIAVVNSINIGIKNKNPKTLELVQNADLVGYDETHHLRASSYIEVALSCINSKYLLGWSGSPFHNDNVLENSGDALIYGMTGGPILKIPYSYLRKLGLISDAVVHMKKVPGNVMKYPGRYNVIYDRYIVNNKVRNDMIINETRRFVKNGFQTLVLVQRIEHAKTLMSGLSDLKTICVFGGNKGLVTDKLGCVEECPIDYSSVRSSFEAGAYDIMIGSQVADEGMDLPSIGAVVMAGGGKSKIKTLQRLGRGLRRKKVGPNTTYILDFEDNGHVYLLSQTKKRKALYELTESIFVDQYQFVNMIIAHGEILRDVK